MITPDGSWVLFGGPATNLVAGQVDTNGRDDVFLFERVTGMVTLVSRAAVTPERTGDNYSLPQSLSADGRYVAFESYAMDLVAGQVDTYFQSDAFLFDRITGQTVLVSHQPGSSVTSAGHGAAALVSADGNFVAFESASGNLVPGQLSNGINVFLYDRQTGTVALVSHIPGYASRAGNGWSAAAAISPNGDLVVLASSATNLVSGQVDTNAGTDVFLFERSTGAITLVSHAVGLPAQTANEPAYLWRMSEYGSRVAFYTSATDVVAGQVDANDGPDVFLADPTGGTITLVSHAATSPVQAANGHSDYFAQSADGGYVAFLTSATDLDIPWADHNGTGDLVLYEAATGAMRGLSRRNPELPSLTPGSHSYPGGMSADGRFVVFVSAAANVIEGQLDTTGTAAFLVDRLSGSTTLVSHRVGSPVAPADGSFEATISADGNYVAFLSVGTDLVPGQVDSNGGSDLFLFERVTGATTLVTRAAGAAVVTANAPVYGERFTMSADGRFLAFASSATNLVSGQLDGNGGPDIFVFDRLAGVTTLVSRAVLGPTVAGNRPSSAPPSMDASGDAIVFESSADDMVPGQDDGTGSNVYLFSRSSGTMTLVSHAAADPLLTANSLSGRAVVSADGSHVAFYSAATDLVPGQDDVWGTLDVFLFARSTGSVMLVSRAAGTTVTTTAGEREWLGPLRLSADGSVVAFSSTATNLISSQEDLNDEADVFLFNRIARSMTLVSHAAASTTRTAAGLSEPVAISADGRSVVFVSVAADLVLDLHDSNGGWDLFVFLPASQATLLVSRADEAGLFAGNASSVDAYVSPDGNQVLFGSYAGDLVAGDFNQRSDVFVFGPVRTVADLTVSASGTPDPVGGGGTLTYAIAVLNLGPDVAYDVSVTDSLPPDVALVSAAGMGWDCDAFGDEVTCTRAAVDPGAAPEIIIRVRVPLSAGVLVNGVSVTSTRSDAEPANDHATVETTVDADLIFRDSFESGSVTAWSVANSGGGDLGVSASSAMASTQMGLEGLVNDTAPLFVEDRTPVDEGRYRARFYLDPSGFDPGEAQSAFRTRVFLALEESPTRRLLAVVLRRRAGQYGVMVKARLDDDSHVDTGFFEVTGGPHALELEWKRGTAPGAADGELRLWIDGAPMATLMGLTTNRSSVDSARLGALSLKVGASGLLRWDHFESRRSSYIGP
jgi:uncharacterized repeat protein (TIGR01451 family)